MLYRTYCSQRRGLCVLRVKFSEKENCRFAFAPGVSCFVPIGQPFGGRDYVSTLEPMRIKLLSLNTTREHRD